MAWSRESRQARGYGKEWDKVRKQVLDRDFGICQPCQLAGRIHAGNEVDHIVSKAKAKRLGWTDERTNHPDNLQTINKTCHIAKTQEEQGKAYKPKPVIGADGWPKRM